jgi:hypothetical protein
MVLRLLGDQLVGAVAAICGRAALLLQSRSAVMCVGAIWLFALGLEAVAVVVYVANGSQAQQGWHVSRQQLSLGACLCSL